jgi:cell division protein FtsI (penicillin-binding protein 3)
VWAFAANWFVRLGGVIRRVRPDRLSRRGRERTTQTWRQVVRGRLVKAGLFFAMWGVGIEARLVYLQVINHEELTARAEGQQRRSIEAHPKRGEILDRNGRILAYSVDGDAIYVVPKQIANVVDSTTKLCAVLDCSDEMRVELESRFSKSSQFEYVRRQVPPDIVNRVAELNLSGVGFLSENRRYYPNAELAAHVLGYVGIDNQGLSGIESTYDEEIRGLSGKTLVQTDARGRAFSRVERPPTAGVTLELTIDTYLQHIAERELERAVLEHRADAGTVVVLDPNTGETLAMANWPTFNPNAFTDSQSSARRNRAIQDTYEPGSTFKIVTASAALEEGVVTRDQLFDVSAGSIRVGSSRVSDMAVSREPLTFDEVMIKSSNVGAVMVGLQLGSERLSRYIRRFGFGQALARDLPGQGRGIVHSPAAFDNDREMASLSIGYAVTVTPLQMAAAVSAVANGGELVEPRLVRAVIRNGVRAETPIRTIRRAISVETASELTNIMERVVEEGTARAAQIPGYRVAGKTGTSEKLVNGQYSGTDHIASFVGFVPSRRPVLTILVMVDTPRGGSFTGGRVAAPVFRSVAEESLRYLAIPRTVEPVAPLLIEVPETSRLIPVVKVSSVRFAPGNRLMPDLRGMSARQAVQALGPFRVTAHFEGDGFVTRYEPIAGTTVEPGTTVRLWMERRRISAEEGRR